MDVIVIDQGKNKHESLGGIYERKSIEPVWTQLLGENSIWAENNWMIGRSGKPIFCSTGEAKTIYFPNKSTKWKHYKSNSENDTGSVFWQGHTRHDARCIEVEFEPNTGK